MDTTGFSELIYEKQRELYREMPWRSDTRPYYVLVSEIMLQQTQVDRVIPKFMAFIHKFPDVADLAAAPLSDVLVAWNGLGYNRRAKYLHEAAKMITTEFSGTFPANLEELMKLPGVGPNTAGAIMAYAYNQPVIFVETNVRTVYFYHFFEDGEKVTDGQIRMLLEQTLDAEHPREFYWALMDYGSWLKRRGAGRVQQSRHYKKQSPLKGSIREVRGRIIRVLMSGDLSPEQLITQAGGDDRFEKALQGLLDDGLVTKSGGVLHLTK